MACCDGRGVGHDLVAVAADHVDAGWPAMIELPSTSGLDVRTCVVREMIMYRVQREMTCRYSGRVLDVDTCVALVGGPDHDDVLAVLSPESWVSLPDHPHVIRVMSQSNGPVVSVWVGRVEQVSE